jgi:hypothetical protein
LLPTHRLLALAESYGILQEPLTGLTLFQFLSMHCSEALLTRSIDVEAVTAEVSKLAVVREVAEGQQLFAFGEVPDSFFLILKVGPVLGRVGCRLAEEASEVGQASW